MQRRRGRGAPGVSKGYGVTQPTRPPPLVARAPMSTGAVLPEYGWCANCYRNGHPAYLCPAPHRQEWPAPPSFVPLLPPARAKSDELDVEVTWDGLECDCDRCYGLRVALRLINR
jgi:hypothetical protein